ncbi:MAG: hypothetical protein KAI39_07890 [Desulfobulbaceae bacterium]|nr:hypothetical protein [Desulfobulbaceae bacterium]
MNTNNAAEQTAIAKATSQAGVEVSKVGVYAIAFSAGLIGCWSVACLVAGTINSGGPVGLITNFIKSFIG